MNIPFRRMAMLYTIRREVNKKRKRQARLAANMSELSDADRQLILQIRERTRLCNRNNVTRTMAYYDYYRRHPEIHWAFLGHMVSRNGGWNMTDLKGELLSRLLSESEQNDFFQFLERGNWLIFQDVYPQCLLYEESLRKKTNLFYLLPCFGVSVFMEAIWDQFWKTGDRALLAIGMIINEQNYLEKRAIQNPHYQKTVLHTLEFKLQDLLRLNQILFPCYQEGSEELYLVGQTLQHFASLHERIRLGKRLYALLFGRSDVLQGALRWAEANPHTGSRKDYWPHLFHDVKVSIPGIPYLKRTANGRLRPGARRKSSSRSWRKPRSASARRPTYLPSMIFASWLGTYLDLICVKQKLYSFPVRPFPELFEIHIGFTLLVLPLVTAFCLALLQRMRRWQRGFAILLFGIIAAYAEQFSEAMGWFVHSSDWRHIYSFFGYVLFMGLVWKFHRRFS
ncbi:CBO0543 family protein [Brevibacillus sp. TJ4]|uniref:CBO0543 family protein n=1 Tax=Brevibacillus sp. TJ4 TaxID=3234853 RepID=UPI0037D499C5